MSSPTPWASTLTPASTSHSGHALNHFTLGISLTSAAHDDIEHRFAHHPADSYTRRAAHESVRSLCRTLARHLLDVVPPCDDRDLAIEHLEDCMFRANAAIARHHT
ncbi:DUF7681 family protein [Kutzneria albida]|uniref:Acb2/Tad1 domain-containing protein n=1 Tax=Kutzneria albida TaxID=43357 RepID=UPI003B82CC42